MAQTSRQFKYPPSALTRGRDKGGPNRINPKTTGSSKPAQSKKK